MSIVMIWNILFKMTCFMFLESRGIYRCWGHLVIHVVSNCIVLTKWLLLASDVRTPL